jgi:CelD/BcsL family acetyltransferase involved in cellulose biosynthesis
VSALRIEWIANLTRFGELSTQWDALLEKDWHPFDLHGWYLAWWGVFGGSSRLAVCTAWRDGELVAALPLRAEDGRLSAMANYHSGMFRPLAVDDEAMKAVLAEVLTRRADEIELPMLPSADKALPLLEDEARSAGRRVLSEAGPVSPRVDTSGDIETWRKEKKARWKGRLARYRRKMIRDHDATFEIVVAPDDLEVWLQQGFQVEASGWKGSDGTAILSEPETAAFYREVARTFHARDELRLSRIVLDGEVVAFSFCLLAANRLYSLKAGYDESWGKLVPGLVMQLSIVERCFDLGLDAYELLGGTSDWKEKVSTGNRPQANVRIYPQTLSGALKYGYRARVRPSLKRAYRRVRPVSQSTAASRPSAS